MSTRPIDTEISRIGFENSKLRAERLHFEHAEVTFEVGPVGVVAKIRGDGRPEYAGPLDAATIDALYELGEREEWVGRDPHNLLSSDFKRKYDGVRHANRQMVSDTPNDKKRRCPGCGSVAITPLSTKTVSNTAPDEKWKCKKCTDRFRTPLPPECECDDEDGGADE